MELPEGFVDLAAAYKEPNQTLVNIIGVVTDMMPITTTSSGQYMFTFSLLDGAFQDSNPGLQGLQVRFFERKDVTNVPTKIPELRGIGDVVLLRSIKMWEPNKPSSGRSKMALNCFQTASLVFHAAAIPSPNFRIAANDKNKIICHGAPAEKNRLSLVEQAYVIDIKHAMGSTIAPLIEGQHAKRLRDADSSKTPMPKRQKLTAGNSSAAMHLGPKFRLISDLSHMLFADIVGEVVKRFMTQKGTCDLYITDYTENQEMFYYLAPEEEAEDVQDGDSYGYCGPQKLTWPGPYGYRVLKVNAMMPHADIVIKTVEKGDFVLLRNVKAKIQNGGSRLEGDLWPDMRYPDKVQVRKLNRSEYQQFAIPDIQRRKEQYWSERNRLITRNTSGKNQPKPLEPENMDDIDKIKSRSKKKKKKKKNSSEALINPRPIQTPESGTSSDMRNTDRSSTNRHVHCGHQDIRLVTVRDILDPHNLRHSAASGAQTLIAPFVNARYRARVRVVDYEPKALEDFSIPSISGDDDDDASDNMAWVDGGAQRYEWYFRLLLEGANVTKTQISTEDNRIWVDIGHEQAQFLFGNTMNDPRDLRHDTQQLTKLRETLFVLWGNLEEGGGQGLSNLPFECCIMEYGVEIDSHESVKRSLGKGWSRAYSMFGTTIM